MSATPSQTILLYIIEDMYSLVSFTFVRVYFLITAHLMNFYYSLRLLCVAEITFFLLVLSATGAVEYIYGFYFNYLPDTFRIMSMFAKILQIYPFVILPTYKLIISYLD